MQGTFVRAFFALGLLTAAAPGATLWNATLNQGQEVPPSGSPATGTGTASYDPATTILTVTLDWNGLSTPAMMGHIHCCVPPGTNGPVAVPLASLPAVASASYSNAFNLSMAGTFGAGFLSARGGDVSMARTDLLAALDGGLAYFNLHTEAFPDGEIRGNLSAAATTAVPESSALSLLIVGLTLIGVARLFPRQ